MGSGADQAGRRTSSTQDVRPTSRRTHRGPRHAAVPCPVFGIVGRAGCDRLERCHPGREIHRGTTRVRPCGGSR